MVERDEIYIISLQLYQASLCVNKIFEIDDMIKKTGFILQNCNILPFIEYTYIHYAFFYIYKLES